MRIKCNLCKTEENEDIVIIHCREVCAYECFIKEGMTFWQQNSNLFYAGSPKDLHIKRLEIGHKGI